MKKLAIFSNRQIRYFIFNSFWNLKILILIFLALGLNIWMWYLYFHQYKSLVNITAIGYASAVMILNLILGNIIYPKQGLVTYILLGTSLLIQVFILFYFKISYLSGVF